MTLIYTNFFFTYQILKSLKDILKYLFFFLEMIFSIVCLSCGLNSQSKEFSVSTTILKKKISKRKKAVEWRRNIYPFKLSVISK